MLVACGGIADFGARLKGVDSRAQGNALGITARIAEALKGRQNNLAHAYPLWVNGAQEVQRYFALSGLGTHRDHIPRALPWALLLAPYRRMILLSERSGFPGASGADLRLTRM